MCDGTSPGATKIVWPKKSIPDHTVKIFVIDFGSVHRQMEMEDRLIFCCESFSMFWAVSPLFSFWGSKMFTNYSFRGSFFIAFKNRSWWVFAKFKMFTLDHKMSIWPSAKIYLKKLWLKQIFNYIVLSSFCHSKSSNFYLLWKATNFWFCYIYDFQFQDKKYFLTYRTLPRSLKV